MSLWYFDGFETDPICVLHTHVRDFGGFGTCTTAIFAQQKLWDFGG